MGDSKEAVLEAFEKAGKPLRPGDVANLIELLVGWGWANTKFFVQLFLLVLLSSRY